VQYTGIYYVDNIAKEQSFVIGYKVEMPSVEGIMSLRQIQGGIALLHSFYCTPGPNKGLL
jgi:hypothetical protein